MQRMRDVLRSSLGVSLRDLTPEDRLAAAWQVVCGQALAGRAQVLYLDADNVLHVKVLEASWFEEFFDRRSALARDLARIAGVPLAGIHFEKNR